MRILNLYAGIGGNRKLWSDEHEVTAIESNQAIADAYKYHFPNDTVIVADAHQYLVDHYKEFDPTSPNGRLMAFVCKTIIDEEMMIVPAPPFYEPAHAVSQSTLSHKTWEQDARNFIYNAFNLRTPNSTRDTEILENMQKRHVYFVTSLLAEAGQEGYKRGYRDGSLEHER